jgi:hypothetical protein
MSGVPFFFVGPVVAVLTLFSLNRLSGVPLLFNFVLVLVVVTVVVVELAALFTGLTVVTVCLLCFFATSFFAVGCVVVTVVGFDFLTCEKLTVLRHRNERAMINRCFIFLKFCLNHEFKTL